MPWHLEPKKDVAICDKPRGVDKHTVIRGSPNGETPLGGVPTELTVAGCDTGGATFALMAAPLWRYFGEGNE